VTVRFTLSIDCDNAAFEADDETATFMPGELARILQVLADGYRDDSERTRIPLAVGEAGNLRDINGNTVGKWEVTES
jgi:hypothetical protein